MDFRLLAFKRDPPEGKFNKTVCFAVVDLSKSKSYPSNFVCMLPLKMQNGKVGNVFGDMFGDKCTEVALGLLKDALKRETDFEVKAEIEKRLKLLDPKQANLVKCGVCGKQFQVVRLKKFKQNLCPECLTKRYRPKEE
jgi:hypothetical protein